MSSQLDATLAHAIQAFQTGKFPSIRATAMAYLLSKSILRRQLHNLLSMRTNAATSK